MKDSLKYEPKHFQCGVCHEIFTSLELKKIHTNKCKSGKRSFYCDICGLKFSTNSLLVEHKKLNHQGVGIKKFKCHICNSAFTRGYNLKPHIKSDHATKKPWKLADIDGDFYGV